MRVGSAPASPSSDGRSGIRCRRESGAHTAQLTPVDPARSPHLAATFTEISCSAYLCPTEHTRARVQAQLATGRDNAEDDGSGQGARLVSRTPPGPAAPSTAATAALSGRELKSPPRITGGGGAEGDSPPVPAAAALRWQQQGAAAMRPGSVGLISLRLAAVSRPAAAETPGVRRLKTPLAAQ